MNDKNEKYTDQFYPGAETAPDNQGPEKSTDQIANNSTSQQNEDNPSPLKAINAPSFYENGKGLNIPSLPKGGGALKGIGEKYETNPVTGTASVTVPIAMSPGRNGFAPQFSLNYDSGSGNSPYGLGWNLTNQSITIKTDKGLPQYYSGKEEDVYIFSGAEDLVPVMIEDSEGNRNVCSFSSQNGDFMIFPYRPRTEGSFIKIEKWVKNCDKTVHWRTVSKENITSVFGESGNAKIVNPADDRQIYSWLLERVYDGKNQVMHYVYKAENISNVPASSQESMRLSGDALFVNRYLKEVRYGNISEYHEGVTDFTTMQYHFCLLFDYGEHDAVNPSLQEVWSWPVRKDPFSSFRSRFEIRTYRLCHRMLMFHKFSTLNNNEWTLVKATQLDFVEKKENSLLASISHQGKVMDSVEEESFQSYPPLTFSYSQLENKYQQRKIETSLINGFPGHDENAEWADLLSEGASGVLVKAGGQWLYGGQKQIWHDDTVRHPEITLLPPVKFRNTPSLAGGQLRDINGSRKSEYVINDSAKETLSAKGFYAINNDGQGSRPLVESINWEAFRTFDKIPNINFSDPNLHYIDLTGDGYADILMNDEGCFTSYQSLAERGYEPARKLAKAMDERNGPVSVVSNNNQRYFIADMTGDGLSDIVRIQNGTIGYWPNKGFGKFGGIVSMENAPCFEIKDMFDPSRIRLADIDGNGCTDVIYLGNTGCSLFKNNCGNSWSNAEFIHAAPVFANHSGVQVMDVDGSGTSSLVWDRYAINAQYGSNHQHGIYYLPLSNGVKPSLMQSYSNNMGATTSFYYVPSTKFYFQDKLKGRAWATQLGFPVQVVEKIRITDEPSACSYETRYAYHHGFFDVNEREFRGFGFVETWQDTTQFGENNSCFYTKTWFHTGSYQRQKTIENCYQKEYFNLDQHAWSLDSMPLPEGLSEKGKKEAVRTLRGSQLRKETYGIDSNKTFSATPYTVEHATFEVKCIQKPEGKYKGVFIKEPVEQLQYHYERNAEDPRISHTILLESDAYGNPLKQAVIAYPRRLKEGIDEQQKEMLVAVALSNYINTPDNGSFDFYRIGMPCEHRVCQLHNLLPASEKGKFSKDDFSELNEYTLLEHCAVPIDTPYLSLFAHQKQLYWDKELLTCATEGVVAHHGLIHHTESLAFSRTMLDDIVQKKNDSLGQTNASIADIYDLIKDSSTNFMQDGNTYWKQSERVKYDAAKFYQPVLVTDVLGNNTLLSYDAYALLAVAVTDTYGNVNQYINDYCVLQPSMTCDPNLNYTAVNFNGLGQVTALAYMGKGYPIAIEGDSLNNPSVEYEYNLQAWLETGYKPVYSVTSARIALRGTQMLTSYTYSDGLGRELQTKVQAEGENANSPSVRWCATGTTVYNAQGKIWKKYEPWFSDTPDYESQTELTATGVTAEMYYDPAGRLIRTEMPDGTYTRVVFDAWKQQYYDANDNVLDSAWFTIMMAGGQPKNSAAEQSLLHADTPKIIHFDAMARAFLSVDDNKSEKIETRQKFDIQGNITAVIDALGREMTFHQYNYLGELVYTHNIDSGKRVMINNAAGLLCYQWDDRNFMVNLTYDGLLRNIGEFVDDGISEKMTMQMVYGTDPQVNSVGQLVAVYDQSGKTSYNSFDILQNPLSWSKQYTVDAEAGTDWSATPRLCECMETTQMKYDLLKRPTDIIAPDGTVTQMAYNAGGLLERVTHGGTALVTNVDYNARGQRTAVVYGNGTRTGWTYDELNFRLERMSTTRGSAAVKLQDISYVYDAVGNITSMRDDAQQTTYFNNSVVEPVQNFTYDALYRLIAADGREMNGLTMPSHAGFTHDVGIPAMGADVMQRYFQSYQYDRLGNILQIKNNVSSNTNRWIRNYTYAAENNRLLHHGDSATAAVQYQYDSHGNVVAMPHLPVMKWDYANRLRSVELNAAGDKAFYCYDWQGERVRKVVKRSGGVVEERRYMGGYEVYRKTVAGATILQRTTHNISDGSTTFCRMERRDTTAPVLRYQYANHLGSASLELDAGGLLISYEEYRPFGTTSYRSGRTATEVSLKRYHYCGKERDEESGLYYYGARFYADWLARFVSVDPLATERQWLNPYNYVQNNPINRVDPTGALDDDPPTLPDKDDNMVFETDKAKQEYHKYMYGKSLNRKGTKIKTKKSDIEPAFVNIIDEIKANADGDVHFTTNFDDIKDFSGTQSEPGGTIAYDGTDYWVFYDPAMEADYGASGIFEESYHLNDALKGEHLAFAKGTGANAVYGTDGLDIHDEVRAKMWVANNIKSVNISNPTSKAGLENSGLKEYTHYGYINKKIGNDTERLASELHDGIKGDKRLRAFIPMSTSSGSTFGGSDYPYTPAGFSGNAYNRFDMNVKYPKK